MKKPARILLSGLLGGAVCAVLSAAVFTLAAMSDGTSAGEALAYGAIVGFLAAFAGALIGLIIGAAGLGVPGGALVGFLTTAAVIAVYVLVFSQPGRALHFLRESVVILVVLALPTTLTGILAGLLNRALNQPRHD